MSLAAINNSVAWVALTSPSFERRALPCPACDCRQSSLQGVSVRVSSVADGLRVTVRACFGILQFKQTGRQQTRHRPSAQTRLRGLSMFEPFHHSIHNSSYTFKSHAPVGLMHSDWSSPRSRGTLDAGGFSNTRSRPFFFFKIKHVTHSNRSTLLTHSVAGNETNKEAFQNAGKIFHDCIC